MIESDSRQFNYSNHIVAFLDLLGQKEKLQEIDGILENIVDPEKTMNRLLPVLTNTVGAIRSFRDSFKDYFNTYMSHEPSITIPPEIKDQFTEMRSHSEIRLQSFSDTTIVWSPIQPKNEMMYAQVLNSVHGILASVGMITPLYLSKGFPIRGGIEIEGGIKVDPDEDEIYGPVLNRAYTLECKMALYPRVLVGDGLVKFLRYFEGINFDNKVVERYCKSIARRSWDWIVEDEDGLLMVHYLGPASLEYAIGAFEISDYFRDVLDPIQNVINENIEKFKPHTDKESLKLLKRYKRLNRYYEKYVDDWKK